MGKIHRRRATSRFRARLQERRRSLRSEAGFALIEVLVSAALLTVVAGGVLAGIDGPSAISGRNETRTQASDLAQQDQERMRGLPVDSLIGYTNTRSVTVGSQTYSVNSTAVWIRDANDTNSCTVPGNSTSGDYLKITSKVTPPAAGATPVQLDSLVSLPLESVARTKGELSIQILDQANQPVVGQSVSIAGPASMTVATNTAGCAVFGLITAGNYTVSYSRAGWVDPSGVTSVSFPTSVTAQSTNLVTRNYAQAGTINVSVNTSVSGTVSASFAPAVTVVNAGIPTGTLTFPANPPSGASSFALAVYPFASGYGVWAGGCSTENPTLYGQAAQTATPAPGGSASVTVRQPAIDLTVKRQGVLYASPDVWITNTDAGCGTAVHRTSNSSGKLADPGFPYGHYTVCADDTSQFKAAPVTDTNPAGTALLLDIPKKAGGTCP